MRSSDWSSDVLFRSAGQVRLRAERLGLSNAPIQLAAATSVRDILTTLGMMDTPSLLVIDSLQTMHSDQIEGAPGPGSQVQSGRGTWRVRVDKSVWVVDVDDSQTKKTEDNKQVE